MKSPDNEEEGVPSDDLSSTHKAFSNVNGLHPIEKK